MREIIRNLAYFVVLVIVFSGLTACTDGEASPEIASETSGPAEASESKPENTNYPPLAEAISNAEMRHLDGSTSKVSDLKGKVLLLNMWATWCGPCRAEMPALVNLQNKYRDKDFEIIGLNTDDGDTEEMVDKFAAEMKLNYTLVWASTPMQKALLNTSKFPGIPQSFLVDRHGRLRGIFVGAKPSEIEKMKESVAAVVSE